MHFFKSFSVLLLGSLCVAPLAADGPVWKITDGDRVLYLGGTIHVLAESDYPLPQAFYRAYGKAQKLVLEIDPLVLRGYSMRAFQADLLWPAGENLQSKVSESTWKLFVEWLQSRSLPVGTFNLYKPGGLIMTLLPIELMRIGVTTEGVDKHFGDRALDDGLAVAGLETLEFQMAVIEALGIGDEDNFLRYLIVNMDAMASQFTEMREAWRSGDRQALIRTAELELLQNQFPDIYQSLIADRNNNWMSRLDAMLADVPVELVLVGALHLVGKDGLLRQFAERGYRVEQLQ